MSIILKIILILVLIIIGIILFLFIRFQVFKIKENKQGWRTRSVGRDSILYEEKINNKWKRIVINGEMQVGVPIYKILFFKSKEEWKSYPSWAQNREKIIQRIKQNYPKKSTEYSND